MGKAGWAFMLAAMLGVTGCSRGPTAEERALIAEFDMITTQDDFEAAVIGTLWRSDEITVRFSEDGTLSGDINGVPVTGSWTWRGETVCTAFRVSDSGGAGCSLVGIQPGALLVVPGSGEGAPYTYTAA